MHWPPCGHPGHKRDLCLHKQDVLASISAQEEQITDCYTSDPPPQRMRTDPFHTPRKGKPRGGPNSQGDVQPELQNRDPTLLYVGTTCERCANKTEAVDGHIPLRTMPSAVDLHKPGPPKHRDHTGLSQRPVHGLMGSLAPDPDTGVTTVGGPFTPGPPGIPISETPRAKYPHQQAHIWHKQPAHVHHALGHRV